LVTEVSKKIFVEPYREAIETIIRKIGYDYDFDIEELEIPEDHIHMVVRGELKLAFSHVMRVIKASQLGSFSNYIPIS
jgi:putative transposase